MATPDSPFERFKQFVAQTLTVTKEDIQKVKHGATEPAPERRSATDESGHPLQPLGQRRQKPTS